MSIRSRVYVNLNNGKYSIKQRIDGKWVVVGHCDACQLSNAKPFVSEKSRLRVNAIDQREVHAWVEGDLSSVTGFVSFRGRVVNREPSYYAESLDCITQIHYHPKESGEFHDNLGDAWNYDLLDVADFGLFGMYVGYSC